MNKHFLTNALLACALGTPCAWSDEADGDVRTMPMSMTTQVDAGQIVEGHIDDESGDNKFLQRTSVWLTQEVVIRERLNVKVGVGGLFWYALPEGAPNGDAAHKSGTKFGPGITRADMTYRFGSSENPMFTLQAGFFPYKYNPDAMNLGEYLLRSGTYPGVVVTGGWNIISQAGYMMQGVRLNMSLWNGKFQSELLFPMERDVPPMGDLSPTYIFSLAPLPGIEIGGGVACNHCISVQPSKTSPKVKYVAFYPADQGPGNAFIIPNPNFDTSIAATDILGSNPRYTYDSTRFYTFQGVKLMGRISLDPKVLVPMPFLGSQDLKIFAELAVLGVKDYPFYYEKIQERMPVMAGINLPAFKLLDALSFQMEYYDSPLPNTWEMPIRYQSPTTNFVTSANIRTEDPNGFDRNSSVVTRDNWKWSLYAKKEIIKGFRLYAQVASDHLRVPEFTSRASFLPITDRNGKDWYWLMRFELGI